MTQPILQVKNLLKIYRQGFINKRETFRLAADFTIDTARVVGVMGPNGSGKTTLFEMITGSNLPTSGSVLVNGRNIHDVKYAERDRLAIHYHQSYQVRHFARTKPSFMMTPAGSDYPIVHLFDEPQFNTQDGYIGFMLDFFKKLRAENRLIFLCMHPNEPFHLDILQEICEQFIFVKKGQLVHADDFATLTKEPAVRDYLGTLLETAA